MVQFIKIGADRIKLDTIERYGIKCSVRYLVKDADELGVEVDGAIFDSAYTQYGASWREDEDIKTSEPIHDMNTGLPVKINGEVVGYGCIPPGGFIVKKDRILYVDDNEYCASVVTKRVAISTQSTNLCCERVAYFCAVERVSICPSKLASLQKFYRTSGLMSGRNIDKYFCTV